MRRAVFDEDHESFRKTLRAFIQAEVVPHYQEWFDAGIVPRDFYYKLGELGVFGIEVPEEYGGAGIATFKYYAIEAEEMFVKLMGEEVEPRRDFIVENALNVRNLDV